jgi:hypothetical protein
MSEMLRIGAGALVWAAHFAVLYGVTALACARDHPRLAPWVIAIATAAGVAMAAVIAVRSYRRRNEFAHWMAAGVAAVAILAMVWEALAGFVSRSCA